MYLKNPLLAGYLSPKIDTMRHMLVTLGIMCFSWSAHAQAKLTPLQLNDKLTEITDSLYVGGQNWGRQFNIAHKSKTYSSLRPQREYMSRFINSSIARVNAMQDVNNSKPLRMAMVGFLRYELRMVTEAFLPLEKLTAESTDQEFNTAFDNLKTLSATEGDELRKVSSAQDTYAKENGFRIQSVEEATREKG
jgi:hypothetical protein